MWPWEITAPWNIRPGTGRAIEALRSLDSENSDLADQIVAKHRWEARWETMWYFIWLLVGAFYLYVYAACWAAGYFLGATTTWVTACLIGILTVSRSDA